MFVEHQGRYTAARYPLAERLLLALSHTWIGEAFIMHRLRMAPPVPPHADIPQPMYARVN